MQTFKNLREDSLEEVLKAMDPTGKWIHDFVHSDNPKFAGKTKKERIHMALGAAYAAKKQEENVAEAKDPRQYDYEGDMAKSQLRSIIMNAQQVHDMLEDDTNMAEWVQSKITLAADYISTVADYMAAEMKEEVEHIDELSKSTLGSYAKKAGRDATITRKIAADFEHQGNRAKSPGMKQASDTLSQKYKEKSWKRRDGADKAIDRLTAEKKD